MPNGSLDQGSLICLKYAYFFRKPDPEYAYKPYAYPYYIIAASVCVSVYLSVCV